MRTTLRMLRTHILVPLEKNDRLFDRLDVGVHDECRVIGDHHIDLAGLLRHEEGVARAPAET